MSGVFVFKNHKNKNNSPNNDIASYQNCSIAVLKKAEVTFTNPC